VYKPERFELADRKRERQKEEVERYRQLMLGLKNIHQGMSRLTPTDEIVQGMQDISAVYQMLGNNSRFMARELGAPPIDVEVLF
jgi:hypothetical protein